MNEFRDIGDPTIYRKQDEPPQEPAPKFQSPENEPLISPEIALLAERYLGTSDIDIPTIDEIAFHPENMTPIQLATCYVTQRSNLGTPEQFGSRFKDYTPEEEDKREELTEKIRPLFKELEDSGVEDPQSVIKERQENLKRLLWNYQPENSASAMGREPGPHEIFEQEFDERDKELLKVLTLFTLLGQEIIYGIRGERPDLNEKEKYSSEQLSAGCINLLSSLRPNTELISESYLDRYQLIFKNITGSVTIQELLGDVDNIRAHNILQSVYQITKRLEDYFAFKYYGEHSKSSGLDFPQLSKHKTQKQFLDAWDKLPIKDV